MSEGKKVIDQVSIGDTLHIREEIVTIGTGETLLTKGQAVTVFDVKLHGIELKEVEGIWSLSNFIENYIMLDDLVTPESNTSPKNEGI